MSSFPYRSYLHPSPPLLPFILALHSLALHPILAAGSSCRRQFLHHEPPLCRRLRWHPAGSGPAPGKPAGHRHGALCDEWNRSIPNLNLNLALAHTRTLILSPSLIRTLNLILTLGDARDQPSARQRFQCCGALCLHQHTWTKRRRQCSYPARWVEHGAELQLRADPPHVAGPSS